MGSIISAINDIIEEHGSWEAYEAHQANRPVPAAEGLKVIYNSHPATIYRVWANGTISGTYKAPGQSPMLFRATEDELRSLKGATIRHPGSSLTYDA